MPNNLARLKTLLAERAGRVDRGKKIEKKTLMENVDEYKMSKQWGKEGREID